jgi:hypothetical protein
MLPTDSALAVGSVSRPPLDAPARRPPPKRTATFPNQGDAYMRTINQMFIVLMLATIGSFTACMGVNAPDRSELGEVEQLFTQCGFGCPAGFHSTGTSCNFSCGSCAGGNNQTTCEANSGTFSECGFGCPGGWHSTGTSCNFSCGSCAGGNNQTTCAPNSGTFSECGFGCPGGWHSIGLSCNFSCGSCAGGNNQTTCAPN